MLHTILAPKYLAGAFVGSAVYIHFRGNVKHRFTRQLSDHSTILAPYNALMYLFSSVPAKPFLDINQFPELTRLGENWETSAMKASGCSTTASSARPPSTTTSGSIPSSAADGSASM